MLYFEKNKNELNPHGPLGGSEGLGGRQPKRTKLFF